MNACYYSKLESPVGPLLLLGDGESLTGLRMRKQKYASDVPEDCKRDDDKFRDAREQLTAYFAGKLRVFDLPLAPEGTSFQKLVWQALLDIPFGATESYGALAKRIGHDQGARAVGLANGHNPIGIIIPCHRVIGSDGSLTGYGGGLDRKQWLLEHEGSYKKAKKPAQFELRL
ncbi:MAG TPA: methylated-DNA--[protein]-cysteine S-methyltransferase [Steroidobacteraceae bacterium]|nr:methylated-DNA--[protein]-cysteine S-methyltransferase [Steroidobacteraceae bacterium]